MNNYILEVVIDQTSGMRLTRISDNLDFPVVVIILESIVVGDERGLDE